ncbi:MAG: tyrosine-type recombinase/integrase [Micavibrio sp.]
MTVFFNKHRGQWAYDFRCNGDRHQGYCVHPKTGKPAQNRTEAKTIEDILKGKIKAGGTEKKEAPPAPVAGFCFAEPIAFYLKKIKDKPSFPLAQGYAKELLEWFGPATDMADIDEEAIAEYTAWARTQSVKTYVGKNDRGEKLFRDSGRPRAPRTVNGYLAMIERSFNAFRLAPENKKYRHLIPPPPEIEYLPIPKRTPTPIPHNLSTRLLEQANDRLHAHLRLAYTLCVHTGMRDRECAQVRDGQFMEAERMIFLTPEQTKTATGRFMPVNDVALQVITECRKVGDVLWEALKKDKALADEYSRKYSIRARGDIPLILYRPNGTGLPRPVKRLANSGWKSMKKNAGVDHRWHDTRAAFCTQALAAGTDIKVVKDLAGHQSIMTTERYLKVADPLLRAAVDALAKKSPLPVESLTKVPYKSKKGKGK